MSPDTPATVLVVDDNASKRLSIEAVLEPLGLTMFEAGSGEAALHAVMDQTFAVILMDVNMPDMDGYETARLIRMRREAEHTPIIFVTAQSADEGQIPVAYASGAVDFITGPIVPEVLRAKVSIFVELFLKSRELERSLSDMTKLSNRFRDSEARTSAVLENVADGIVTLDGNGLIESFNRAATDLFGYAEREMIGQPFKSLLAPDRRAEFVREATESTAMRKDGSTFPIEVDLSDVQLGARSIHIGCLRDISERHEYTELLKHQALHDDLTGLPNRALFGDRVEHAILASARTDEPLALLVLDLDDFKQVNDTLGHHLGDVLLKLVAARLVTSLRDADTVARLGGDEFGVLLPGGTDLAGAASVAWKIQKALGRPFAVGSNHTVDVRASIGIALVPDHGDNIDDLLRRADLAMYDAKRSGGGYATFASEQEAAPARRLALLGNLRHCIERNELVLHYQPKIDLATRETIGVEALIRWNHPSGDLLMPGQFMREVESSELMVPITEWVLNEALHTLRIWRDEGYDLTIAVNFGARSLAEGSGFFETVNRMTDTWGIPRDKLTIELTESALLDTAGPDLPAQLEQMGQRLSIDDFGTGYSSLLYLQRLPVVEIKADRSFVTSLATVEDDAVIVRSTIDLAHNLGARVVAEGVEDEATMDLLIEYGCDEAQGFHFSHPLPADALVEWLQSSPFGLPRRLHRGPSLTGTRALTAT